MNLSTIKSLNIPEGLVKRVLIGEDIIWKKPISYTPIDYIEVTGTQYINTGFTPNNNSRMIVDLEFTVLNSSNQVAGSRYTTTSRAFAFGLNASGKLRFGYGNNYYDGTGDVNMERRVLELDKNTFYMNGVLAGTAPESTFNGYTQICLGSVKATKMYAGYAKFYSCQIYDGGTLIRDFVPCINADGEIGMWDKVEDKFYGNAGSGDFVISK